MLYLLRLKQIIYHSYEMSYTPYSKYLAHASSGNNAIGVESNTAIGAGVSDSTLSKAAININILSPEILINDIASQAQAQAQVVDLGGGEDCYEPCVEYCPPVCDPCPAPCYKECCYVEVYDKCESSSYYCQPKKKKKKCYKVRETSCSSSSSDYCCESTSSYCYEPKKCKKNCQSSSSSYVCKKKKVSAPKIRKSYKKYDCSYDTSSSVYCPVKKSSCKKC